MEKRLTVAEFAELVGTTAKTVYTKIDNSDLPVNERLITVRERVKGRETTLILTNNEQISYYRSLYSKDKVNDSNYYEVLTENNGYSRNDEVNDQFNSKNNTVLSSEILSQFITVNNDLNERYEQKITELIALNNELSDVKSRQLLLEDKAGREGLYLNEIKELKDSNERLTTFKQRLIYLAISLSFIVVGLMTYIIVVNNISNTVNELQEEVNGIKKPVEVVKTQNTTQVPIKNIPNNQKK